MKFMKVNNLEKSEVISFLQEYKGCISAGDKITLQACEQLCREQILCIHVAQLPNDAGSVFYELRPGYEGREAYKKYVCYLKNS